MNRWGLILIGLTHLVNAQDVTLNLTVNNPLQLSANFNLFSPQNEDEYLATQWSKGKLFYTNGSFKHFDSLNFNRYANKVEVVVNNKALSIFSMGISGGLIYNSPHSGTVLLVGKIDNKTRFLVVVSKGQYLLASYLTSNSPSTKDNSKVEGIRFIPKQEPKDIIKEYYVIFRNGYWESIKLTKSTMRKLFNKDKKKLQSIASSKGINTLNKQGLLQLFQLLNKE